MAAASSSSSSSSVTVDGFTYDVFLSFRGEDTRYDFTGSLWKALVDKGIRTFFDEEDIHKGDEITPSLLQSIEQSKMALVVLSPNYASSTFCLDELSHILHCIRGNGRFVWPIFYDVDPSEVRKLKGTYGDAITTHEANSNYSTDRLEKWKKALNQVANLSGTHVKKENKHLYKFIEEIVEEVSTKIKPSILHVADNLVGLESRVKDVILCLDLGSVDKVRMVGIHGIGGVGKTTLAVAVYNSIANQFQGSCYLENVRENFVKHGVTYLQQIILSETVKEKKIELTSSKQGITIIKERLGQKKVLLLLDDVDEAEKLEAIAGSRDWFGLGSRVIITTRNTRLLTCHEVESNYEVNELNKEDAFELLRQKAIRTNEVTPSYMDVLNHALRYASGLPLALEVIGSHLFKKTVEECKYLLDRYERNPDPKIQTILKASFDALDEEEKCIFLDIACVFKGLTLEYVEKVLLAHHGESKKHHISVLIEKSLIKISERRVTLHDLIAEMGEAIERQNSPDDPGSLSRLWLEKDIVQVLEENKGTSKIEMIRFHSRIEVKWNGEAFKKMENLKTLIIRHGASLKSPKHLPNSLRVLEWWNYSGNVPSDFYPKRLVICIFSANCTSFIREDFFKKKFETMRVLTVGCPISLTQIPDMSTLPNLEDFSLYTCYNLIRIDDSVGLLDKLQYLRLSYCTKLKSVPPLKLPSLEELCISSCQNLESFPPVVDGLLGKLKLLSIRYCKKLKSIPPLKLPSLEKLHISSCQNLESFPPIVDGVLGKLKILIIFYCKKLKSIPPLKLPSLEELRISSCHNLESFPPMVDGLLGKLKLLIIFYCKKLCIPHNLKLPLLQELCFEGCDDLERFPLLVDDGNLSKLKILTCIRCCNLKCFPPLTLPSLETLILHDCPSLENFPFLDELLGSLKLFEVFNCCKIKSFPTIKLPSLEKLCLSNCDGLESFSPVVAGLLGKLKVLSVDNCKNLKSIPPLKLPLLEELTLLDCDSLESFPLMMDGSFGKLKRLIVKSCRNLKSFLQLKLASLEKLDLSDCGSLESFLPLVAGWMGKLKVLKVVCCRNHRSIPPIKFASLEELVLSCDCCCDTILEIEELHWLPFSFQDLNCLQTLHLQNCATVQFPTSSIVAMSKQDKDEENVIPIQSSRNELPSFYCRNLSDESLAIVLKWFANVKYLNLSWSKITTLPECFKNCHFLWKLVMDYCEELKEIKGLPPNINTISAFNCSSLTSSCPSKLLNQEVHKFGNTNFILPGVEIPNWFDSESMQRLSVSFWFRNKFPSIALCVVSPLAWADSQFCLRVNINGIKYFYGDGGIHMDHYVPKMNHLWLFHMQNQKFDVDPDIEYLENKWNHAVVNFEFGVFKSGIHVLKEKSSMEDIRFTDPENEVSI